MGRKALLLTAAPVGVRGISRTRKVLNRGRLLRILEAERLITRIFIDTRGQLAIRHADGDGYWMPVRKSGSSDAFLAALRKAWSAYVRAGFAPELRKEYCYRYFQLLDALIGQRLTEPESIPALAALRCGLGFECFGIASASADSVAAGATSTLRNPAYLLTKLRFPDALDSAEHLPLIAPGGLPAGGLLYHYRQHRLSRDSDYALLSYLGVPRAIRSSSFQATASLEQAIGDAADPFAAETAERLARAGVLDYLQARVAAGGGPDTGAIDIVDLGAGTGLVAARLGSIIAEHLTGLGCTPRFRIWFVDLSTSRPARFFASEQVARYVDSLQVVASDYREWLDRDRALPERRGVRVVIMSRFPNNLSDFDIRCYDPASAGSSARRLTGRAALEYLPTRCLAPDGAGPKALVLSNARVWTESGRTFDQASLSPYFLGLRLAATPPPCGPDLDGRNACVHLPLRSFRPDCLLTRSGRSILGVLAPQSDFVVVQDADMRPADLTTHLRTAFLQDLTALDTTRHAGLRRHLSYLVGKRSDPLLQHVEGECLW